MNNFSCYSLVADRCCQVMCSDTKEDLVGESLSGGTGIHRMPLSQSQCEVETKCGIITNEDHFEILV